LRHRAETGFPYGAYTAWRWTLPVARAVFGWHSSLTVSGRDLVPDGPLVVAANHFSHLDPVMVGVGVGRPIRYLAVDELYGNSRFFDGLTLWLGAIPMPRTRAPLGALRLAIAELEAGGIVGLYPEGVRVWRWGERPPKRGAAWLSRRVGVPLLPVAVAGTDVAWGRGARRALRGSIHVEVCDPIHPGDYDDADDPIGEMTEAWRLRIDDVLGPWYGTRPT
jgi:1-acyl-sn-glycerol-3-phosphate acyltransferase